MKLYVNYPTTKEGKDLLNISLAELQATLVLKSIEKLNISNQDKKKVLDGILKELEKRI